MRQSRAQAVARALGWFSIGLGLAELLAPRMVARVAGLRGREGLLQLYGAREIASGIGILLASNPRPWLAARVAGDALDIATLVDARNPKSMAALAAVGGVTALDAYATAALKPQARRSRQGQGKTPDDTGVRARSRRRAATGAFDEPLAARRRLRCRSSARRA
jgi:hypothetical protein